MSIYILREKPIAYISDIRAIVVTDLHIGYEYELMNEGIRIPSQVSTFVSLLKEAKEETKANKLILLGDVKHKVPKSKREEILKVKDFLITVEEEFDKVIICKGNHDDRIEYIVPSSIKVYSSRGFRVDNYGFFHGHAWPYSKLWNARCWVVGHLQPLVEIYKGGKKSIERVVVRGKVKIKKGKVEDIIILPSLNNFLGGFILNKAGEKLENFILDKVIDMENSRVYLLDGTEIGTLKEILNPLK